MRELSRRFRAMNADVEAIVGCNDDRRREAEAALADVERLFRLAESVLSCSRAGSELSFLNRAAGEPFQASTLLFAVVADAVAASQMTDGLFDPTVVGMLAAAGHDRSLDLLADDRAGVPSPSGRPGNWRGVQLDPATRTISLPPRCGLDLDGIARGWTLDRAAEGLRRFGSFAIDAGGDLSAGGRQADGSSWTVGIEDPLDLDRDVMQLDLVDQAIATASVAQHRRRAPGRWQHPLIDPRTGRPSRSGATAATVITPSAARAEALARTALLLGPAAGIRFLDRVEAAEGIVVLDGGYIQRSAGFEKLARVA